MHRINFFWKISFLIEFIVIISFLIFVIVLRISLPGAFQNHSDEMHSLMMGSGMGMMGGQMMIMQLYDLFDLSVKDALWIALPITLLISLISSWLISRWVTTPARKIFQAAQEIAAGNYQKRIPIPQNIKESELDDLQRMSIGFNNMTASLEKNEAMQKQLIGDISHELRTPLTTIKGSMEGLIDGILPAEEKTYLQIYNDATRLQRLVDDLQELSLIEGGELHFEPKPISFFELSSAVCEKLNQKFLTKNVLLQNLTKSDNPLIYADPDRLEQILLNLLSNSLRYTSPGDEVTIETKKLNNFLQIVIKDNGIGIAAEHLPHIFKRFYRTDSSRSRKDGGSGIGLTIAKQLVEAHKGYIQAHSNGVGKGAVFLFTIPYAKKK